MIIPNYLSTLLVKGGDAPMTITEILQRVDIERKIESRFPVRMIFCESLEAYLELIDRLRGVCECCWNIADFCSDKYPDRYPNIRKLIIEVEKSSDKHILISSVGEYLRMSTKAEVYGGREAKFYGLWSRMESVRSKTRIFIPIFAAREYFFRAIGEVNQRQIEFLWDMEENDNKTYNLTVYSDIFRNLISSIQAASGVRDWLMNWENYYKSGSPMVITSQADICEKTFGKVSIDIIENPYEFLCSLDSSIKVVRQDSSPVDFWAELMIKTTTVNSVRVALLEGLNLNEFNSTSIVSRWRYLEPIEQWYVWIWYQIYDSKEYIATIIKKMKVEELEKVPFNIYNDIIYYIDSHPDWITQRQKFINSLDVEAPTKEFFKVLDKKEPEIAIGLLAGKSIEEKAFIIKTVCRWLRHEENNNDIVKRISAALETVYPEFMAYFKTSNNRYGVYTDYFAWYKKKKIVNRPVLEPLKAQNVDFLDTRFCLMAKYNDKDCFSYWIDGFGAEWLSLACEILNRYAPGVFTFTSNIAKCVIPSETAFNEQWNLDGFKHIKKDRLDGFSHKGMPDDKNYFLAVVNQINAISEMIKDATEYLENHEYVIITGDHGSSRLAALAFHEKDGLYVPKGAQSMCLGRFCLLKNEPKESEYLSDFAEYCFLDNKKYLVMKNYDHFIQPGNAAGGNDDDNAMAGEVHGGLTPEECIVPVIVLKRITHTVPLKYTLNTNKIKHTGGKASISIGFNEPVQRLYINSNFGKCQCITKDNKNWTLQFMNLVDGSIEIEIIADNKVIEPKATLTVETYGLKKGSMGGLP